ncbi:MAG TPA: SpoIIE family protein phosphatase [Kofleriaceae bacterium]
MAASRPARAGIPIWAKLIVTMSVVVAAAVGVAMLFAQRAIDRIRDAQVIARSEDGQNAIARDSELVAQAVAASVAFPLTTSTYEEVEALLEAAIDQDHRSGEHRFVWLLARDTAGRVVARTRDAPSPTKLDTYERRLADGLVNNGVVHASIGGFESVYGADIKLQGTFVGKLRIGVSADHLERKLHDAIEASVEHAREERNHALWASIAMLAIGIAVAAFFGIQLTRPIQELTAQAERIAVGDLDSRVEPVRRDELGVLAYKFNVMSEELRRLLAEQTRKASLEREMSLARHVQQAMLPPDKLDQHGAIKVIGYCMPASSCGGDWWTYRKLADGRMLVVVGDATGHGIHSAMIAATARGAVEALASIEERLLIPDQVLRAIDSAIRQLGDPSVLMTAFAALLDPASGTLHYANAGQNFPYVIKLGAERVLGEARIVAASGNPLGDHTIPVEIRRGSLELAPGDLFVCFTDGLVERANRAGQLFGDRRLRGALIGEALPDGRALVALRDRVVQKVEAYAAGSIAEDDITLVMCQFDPAQAQAPAGPVTGRGAA